MSESTHTETESVAEAEDSPDFIRDVVTGRLSGVVVNPETGEHLEAVFKDPTDDELGALEDLEEQAMEGEVDADRAFGARILDDFLLAIDGPDGKTYEGDALPASDDLGMAWKQAVTVGFLKVLGADNEALRDAEEFFEQRLGGNE